MGEGMSSYMVYKVVTKTNASYFKKKEFFVIRRFSDFLGLHQKLAEKYLQVAILQNTFFFFTDAATN